MLIKKVSSIEVIRLYSVIERNKGRGSFLQRGGLYFIFHPKWSKLGTTLLLGPNIMKINKKAIYFPQCALFIGSNIDSVYTHKGVDCNILVCTVQLFAFNNEIIHYKRCNIPFIWK